MAKQKTVQLRIADIDLFNECRDLLKKQLGARLSDSLVTQAALTSLKTIHTEHLITVEDAAEQFKRLHMPAICRASTELINLLMDARLLARGKYEIEGDQSTNEIRLFKDGVKVSAVDDPEPAEAPAWAKALQEKLAVN